MWRRRVAPIDPQYDFRSIMLMLTSMDTKLDELLAREEDEDGEEEE